MTVATNRIALVPARGGSKRLPGKNVQSFFGHPMMAYAISAALNSEVFARVIVSSDDPMVGRVAEWYGAEFMLRPPELASDTAQLTDVAKHVIERLQSEGFRPDVLCQCMPNCPLVRSTDIWEHWGIFNQGHRSFQISAVRYRGVYPHWAVVPDEQQRGGWLLGAQYLRRSQELSRTLCPTGAIWWTRIEDFLRQNAFYGPSFYVAEMDANRGIDIDDEKDLALAELLVRGLTARDGQSPLEPVRQESFLHAGGSVA